MGLGFMLGGRGGMMIALVVAIGLNFFSYWNADKIVLRMHSAREVDERSAPDYYGLVRELSTRAGLPMPKVYIADPPHTNSFATGRDPAHAAVAATPGLPQLLNLDEQAGGLAQVPGHVRPEESG